MPPREFWEGSLQAPAAGLVPHRALATIMAAPPPPLHPGPATNHAPSPAGAFRYAPEVPHAGTPRPFRDFDFDDRAPGGAP